MTNKFNPNKLTIGLKRELKKEDVFADENKLESAVQKIHAAGEKEKNFTEKQKRRLSIDIDKQLHKKLAMRLIETDTSYKDYFIGLIKKDLNCAD